MAGRRLIPILAAVGLIILLQQGLDLRAAALGSDIATANGRLGLVAAVLARGPILLAADALLIMAAVRSRRTGALTGLAVVHLLLALGAIVAAPFLVGDAGRLVDTIGAGQLSGFRITVARILGALIVLGVGGMLAGANLVLVSRSVDAGLPNVGKS